MDHNDPTAETLDIAQYATHGFCPGYPLKRHRQEALANAGCRKAREDWARYLGPAGEFGGCNPINGNFTALVLPLCRPERLSLVAYILEYAFLHDTVVEGVDSEKSAKGDAFSLGQTETKTSNLKTGRKQLQAKMMLQINTTDKVCAARVMSTWQTMLSTTLRDKAKDFSNLEEYLNFRIIDTGAPFVESTMLFGMGMTLFPEEDALLADIIRPCYASLALANDYFSFDREWDEAQSSPDAAAKPMINAVWLYMQWQGVDASEAKRLVIEATNRYEADFLERCERFKEEHAPVDPKLDLYLRALSYQVSGNVVWSLNCPRYHPEFRYDPNAGVEDIRTAEVRGRKLLGGEEGAEGEPDLQRRRSSVASASSGFTESDVNTAYSWGGPPSSRASSVSARSGVDGEHERKTDPDIRPPTNDLGDEHLNAPFNYVKSLPSKGVRDTLADALNLWADLPEDTVSRIKEVVDDLHTASLMLDDIEDSSDLRRGNPAAHTVFGVPQTINSGSFAIVEALRKVHALADVVPGAEDIAFEQLRDLHIGQSYDLHWTRHATYPSEKEYVEMVSKKTGGLFRLLSRLMCRHLDNEVSSAIDDLVTQMGIYFQIRDDYNNIESAEYTTQKGLYQDLDEGKPSHPLIHHLTQPTKATKATNPPPSPSPTSPSDTTPHQQQQQQQQQTRQLQVREILEQRREKGANALNDAHKRLVLQLLRESGSVEHTRDTLRKIERGIEGLVAGVEGVTGRENWVLRFCLWRLKV